jgi:formylglycine-generating enzyme required for sulfatase activity
MTMQSFALSLALLAVMAPAAQASGIYIEPMDEEHPVPPPPRGAAAMTPGLKFRDCPRPRGCPVMVVVPAGSYVMGSPPSETGRGVREGPAHSVTHEGPAHSVTIGKSFAIAKYPVTIWEYDSSQRHRAGGAGGFGPDCFPRVDTRIFLPKDGSPYTTPIVCLSWEQAQSYVRWLSSHTGKKYRLPSEAEWEWAARAGTQTPYPFPDIARHANGAGAADGYEYLAPAGHFPPNRFGLRGMIGNVWEWVEDCYHPGYQGAPADGSAWTDAQCARRMLRGGGWNSPAENLRVTSRAYSIKQVRTFDVSFRVVRDIP